MAKTSEDEKLSPSPLLDYGSTWEHTIIIELHVCIYLYLCKQMYIYQYTPLGIGANKNLYTWE